MKIVRNIFAAFRQLWFPLLLSVMPFLGFYLENNQRQGFELERKQFFWKQNAARMIEDIRSNVTFVDQLSRMGYAFRKRILASCSPDSQIAPDLVVSAFHQSFPKSHCPPESTLYFFSIRAGKLVLLSHPELGQRNQKLLGEMLGRFLEAETISETEKGTLNKRCAGLFGSDLGFAQMAIQKRGKPTPGEFGGKDSFLFWDVLEGRGGKLGVFLLVVPFSTSLRLNSAEFALTRARKSRQNMVPVLVPYEIATSTDQPVFPGGFRPSERLLDLLKQAETPGLREKIAPRGVMSEKVDKLWIQRDFLVSHLPYEVWVFSRAHAGKDVKFNQPFLVITTLIVSLFWLYIGVKAMVHRQAVFISMRFWVLSFFLFLASVSLGSMYLFGAFYIETATFRQVQERISHYSEKIQEADNDVTTVFNNYSRAAHEILGNPSWGRDLFHGTYDRQERCFETARRHFETMQPSIRLTGILAYRFGKTDRAINIGGEHKMLGDLGLEFYQPFAYGGGGLFHPELGSAPFIPQIDPKNKARFTQGYRQALNTGAYPLFNQLRHQTDRFEASGKTFLQFYDYWAENGKVQGLIFFMAPAPGNFQNYLTIATHQLGFESSRNGINSDPVNFVFGELNKGFFVPLSEKNGAFWNTPTGKKFQSVLNHAARTNSFQSFIRGNFAWVAHPCKSAQGFILGAVIPLEKIFQTASAQRGWLSLFVAFLSLPIFVLGVSTANYLLVPLSSVEQGLIMVSRGDLSVKVGLDRNDELGDLARTFDGMIQGFRERKELGRFVSGELDSKISQAGFDGAMKPSWKNGIVLVSDMRDFTTLSESHPAREIISMLNHHHHAMSEVIQAHDGFVDLFIGDAIVAIFLDKEEGTALTSAMKAAAGMKLRHQEIQDGRKAENRFPYQIGIGLSQGEMMTGTLGKSGRLEHVVIGDPRSEAERLEIVSKKGSHTRIIVDQAILERLDRSHFCPIDGERGWELLDTRYYA